MIKIILWLVLKKNGVMKKRLKILLLLPFSTFGQVEPYSIGEIHKIESEVLKESRVLNINLPRNFSTDSTYPVIYVLDGSADEDFFHIVGLVQFFQLQFAMPDHIIIGIENVDRKRDFSFQPTDQRLYVNYPTSGHSADFMQFVEKEMLPYVTSQFKTSGTNFLIGQSLGGLMASEFLLKKPELFSHYLIVSPSLWWDNRSMLKAASELLKNNLKSSTYVSISVGAKEHRIMRKDAKKLHKVLKKCKNSDISVDFNCMRKENHASILHNALYEALFVLYPYQEPKTM